MSEYMIPIPSRVYNAAVGGHVAGADQIIDDKTGLTLDKVAGGALEEKEYTSSSNNGMGRVVLRKNLVEGVNTLTQNMINKSNTIYVIQYDFTLGEVEIPDFTLDSNSPTITINGVTKRYKKVHLEQGKTISLLSCGYVFLDYDNQEFLPLTNRHITATDSAIDVYIASGYVGTFKVYKIENTIELPQNSLLTFEGGSISNGCLRFNDTALWLNGKCFYNCSFIGDIKNSSINIMPFGLYCNADNDDSPIINDVIQICNKNGVEIIFDFISDVYINKDYNRNEIMLAPKTRITQVSPYFITANNITYEGTLVGGGDYSGNGDLVLKGLRINGNSLNHPHASSNGENGLFVIGKAVIEDLYVKNCTIQDGITYSAGAKGLQVEPIGGDVLVNNCRFENCYIGICTIHGHIDSVIEPYNKYQITNITIENCNFGIMNFEQNTLDDAGDTSNYNNIIIKNCGVKEGTSVIYAMGTTGAIFSNIQITGLQKADSIISGVYNNCVFSNIVLSQEAEYLIYYGNIGGMPDGYFRPNTEVKNNKYDIIISKSIDYIFNAWSSDIDPKTKQRCRGCEYKFIFNVMPNNKTWTRAYMDKFAKFDITIPNGLRTIFYNEVNSGNYIIPGNDIQDIIPLTRIIGSPTMPDMPSGKFRGFQVYNAYYKKVAWWDGDNFVRADGYYWNLPKFGTFANAPTSQLDTSQIGFNYFAIDKGVAGVGAMIYYTGDSTTPWAYADGTAVS